MYSKYGAELWRYIPGRDPVSIGAITTGMSSLKNTGFHVFVVRNNSPLVCEHVHENFKDAIAIDPGGSIFETGFVLGTGDVFYFAPGLSIWLNDALTDLEKVQSERDCLINDLPSTKSLEDAVKASKNEFLESPCSKSLKKLRNLRRN